MRSATSYFNGTLYRKTLLRFWPLWAGYGVLWMFFVPLNMLNLYFNRYLSTAPQKRLLDQALSLPGFAEWGLWMAAFFAILCAMAVFGYLYSHRSACWFHALPLRREALFTTQYLAGLSFLLLPQLAVGVLTAIVEVAFLPMEHWGKALGALLLFLLAQSGMVLFFFSFAAFCAMFTGHILALPAFYAILNVLASVIYTLIEGLMMEFFYGYAGSPGAVKVVEYLTPCLALQEAARWWVEYEGEPAHFGNPGAIAAYAAVGVVLALVSLYVYRRRHVETAGDVVAVSLVRPLFKYGVSFCSGLSFGIFTTLFFGWRSTVSVLIPCILIWAVIGYFVAEMLLKKSFRVFKAWKGAAAMAAVLLLLCLGCFMDLFGVETRVPQLDQVTKLTVWVDMGSPSDSGSSLRASFTDQSDIQTFLALHQAIVDDRDRTDRNGPNYKAGDDYITVELRYTLKGGGRLDRDYSGVALYKEDIDKEGSFTYLAQEIMSDRELAALAYNLDRYLEQGRPTGAWLSLLDQTVDGHTISASTYVDEYAQELCDAVRQDLAEGNIGMRYPFFDSPEMLENTCKTRLTLGFTDHQLDRPYSGNPASQEMQIYLSLNAKHTLAVLDKTGLWEEGYALSPWEDDGARYPETVMK